MGTLTEMLMCEDMTSCTDLARRHVVRGLWMRSLHSATVLYSNCYYTVVASIFLVSAASCKAISGVVCICQNFRLFSAILAKVTRPSNATHAD